ncbi:MAG: hypothetical protein WCF85_00860 [Rhodospirillaceae bacterium]
MWKFLVAVMVALLPFSAFAQNQTAQPTVAESDNGGSFGKTLAVTTGVVGGIVIADLLTGGGLTGTLLTTVGLRSATPAVAAAAVRAPISPAIAEARAAGAVLGEQILAATEARDAVARKDMIYAGALGLGGLVGGLFVSHYAH